MRPYRRCLVGFAFCLCLLTSEVFGNPTEEGLDLEFDLGIEDPADDESADDAATERQLEPGEVEYWEAMVAFLDPAVSSQERGRERLRHSANLEFSPAQNFLGICYQSGDYGFERSARKAINWFQLATEQGDRFAMVNLAICYLDGVGVFWKRAGKAQELLEAALAEEGDWYAGMSPPESYFEALQANDPGSIETGGYQPSMQERSEAIASYRLGWLHLRNKERARAHPYFVRAAMVGDRGQGGLYPAAVQAAIDLAFGQGVERDMEAARHMLAHSRTLLRDQAMSYVAGMVDMRSIDRFAMRAAREAVEEASDEAETEMQLRLARTFGDPRSKDFDAEQAALWYELAAEGGHAWAMIRLAEFYSDPTLSIYDPIKAFAWYERGHEQALHLLLSANYAIALYHGIGTEPDREKAKAVFEKYKHTDIVCHLGLLGHCPEKLLTYEERQDLIEHWAEKERDPQAQFFFGRTFYYGWGVEQSNSQAYRWFSRAADADHAQAHYFLGEIFRHGYGRKPNAKKSLAHYERAAELGSVSAAFQLGYALAGGRGMEKDEERSRQYYEQVLELEPDHSGSHNNLGVYYQHRLEALKASSPASPEFEALRDKMLTHYQRASDLGEIPATQNLAELYFEGELIPQDYRTAYQFANTAADQGNSQAYFVLARIFDEGLGVGRNIDEAAHYFRLAGLNDTDRENRRKAIASLCNYYLSGASGTLDLTRAMPWMQLLARQGAARVLGVYGDALLQLEEYKQARRLFAAGTKVDDPFLSGHCHDRLSRIYREGLGVRPNPARAQRYFDRAVQLEFRDTLYTLALQQQAAGDTAAMVTTLTRAQGKGSREAAYTLGRLYLGGGPVEQDTPTAIRLFREAAERNHISALFDLAALTFQGQDGAPSLTEAIQFARRAEILGHDRAGQLREALEKRQVEERSRNASGTGEHGLS